MTSDPFTKYDTTKNKKKQVARSKLMSLKDRVGTGEDQI
jgi:hypothetical protein